MNCYNRCGKPNYAYKGSINDQISRKTQTQLKNIKKEQKNTQKFYMSKGL
jgi:hypothetical protein